MKLQTGFIWRWYSGITLGIRTDDEVIEHSKKNAKTKKEEWMFNILIRRTTIHLPFFEFGWETDYCYEGLSTFKKESKKHSNGKNS